MPSALSNLIAMFPGALLPYAGITEPAAQGWLLCDGRLLVRADYPALFAAIGTTYNTGGESGTQFRIPDLRGRVIAGRDNMGGSAANRLNVTLTGNTTNANATISGLSSTAGLSEGMSVFGTGIPAGATIATIVSATSITISANATANGTGVSLRFGVVDGASLGAVGGGQVHTLSTAQMPSHNHNTNVSQGVATGSIAAFTGGQFNTAGFNTTNTGGGQAHPNVQPTLIANWLIKT